VPPPAGSNAAAAHFLGAKAKVGVALLGLGASGGVAGVALAALLLTAQPTSLRWLLGAALAAQFTLPALLAAPVPGMAAVGGGAAAAGATALSQLLPAWMTAPSTAAPLGGNAAGGELARFWSSLQSPAMSWLWGACLGALLVVLLAKLPVPEE
jgi:hypothetical protein